MSHSLATTADRLTRLTDSLASLAGLSARSRAVFATRGGTLGCDYLIGNLRCLLNFVDCSEGFMACDVGCHRD